MTVTAPAPTPPQRNGTVSARWRAAVGLLILALTLLGGTVAALLTAAAPAHAVPPTEITLEDTAGVIHEPQLRDEVQQIDFYEPTHVVVFTERGARTSNFNSRVLAYAREHRPEWLSPNGQKWADGLYIFALDPDGRHVGTYFGEDRKVSTDLQGDIQDSTKDLLRDAQWTDAAVKGVQEGAALMNRPWYRHPALYGLAGLTAVFGAGTVLVVSWNRGQHRRQARADLQRGREAFSSVTLNLEATELHARTVPADSRYGAMVLERYRTFHERYVELARQSDALSGVELQTLHRKEHRSAARTFADEAQALDRLDDVMAHSSTFLNRQTGWQTGWDVQTEPLRVDLQRIAAGEDSSPQGISRQARVPLESFRKEAETELDRLGAQLESASITPDEALDRLSELRSRLTGLLEQQAASAASGFATSEKERSTMQTAFDESRRASSRSHPGSILDSVHEPGHFWTVVAFSQGYSSGRSTVETARSSASSSTGYGSSGGSFSGAGSSSRF